MMKKLQKNAKVLLSNLFNIKIENKRNGLIILFNAAHFFMMIHIIFVKSILPST